MRRINLDNVLSDFSGSAVKSANSSLLGVEPRQFNMQIKTKI